MNDGRLPIEERIVGVAMAFDEPMNCPVCGGRSIWWCSWYSPKGNEYLLCARCDAKAADEEYFKKIVKRLDELEAEKEAKQ